MSEEPHPFTTIDQQIQLLEDRKLIFRSKEYAKQILSMYGYYNVINGYKDNYVISVDGEEQYKEGVTFEQIVSLFSMDHSIRNEVMSIMIDVEEMLRATVSYVVGEHCGYKKDDYLDITKYRNQSKRNYRFSLKAILKTLNDAYLSDKDPIKYNREKYGNVPPWVLLKGVYFSTIINYLGFFKSPMKSELIARIYVLDPNMVTSETKQIFSDSLAMFLDYRNLCAHGGRIYNYQPKNYVRVIKGKTLSSEFVRLCNSQKLGQLILALDLISCRQYGKTLRLRIEYALQQHCKSYPEDLDYLLDSMCLRDMIDIDLSV